jgi:hypothetical protein
MAGEADWNATSSDPPHRVDALRSDLAGKGSPKALQRPFSRRVSFIVLVGNRVLGLLWARSRRVP